VKFVFTTNFGAFWFLKIMKFGNVYLIKDIHFYVAKNMNLDVIHDITSRCNQQVFKFRIQL